MPNRQKMLFYICSMKTFFFVILCFCTCALAAQPKRFNKQDSINLSFCKCDSLYAAWKVKPDPKAEAPEYNGNGWNRLNNFQGKTGQCGYFNKYYFMYGLHFIYDENDKLIKIKKFYNGKLIGLCDLKK